MLHKDRVANSERCALHRVIEIIMLQISREILWHIGCTVSWRLYADSARLCCRSQSSREWCVAAYVWQLTSAGDALRMSWDQVVTHPTVVFLQGAP